jgi:hypothetical protein
MALRGRTIVMPSLNGGTTAAADAAAVVTASVSPIVGDAAPKCDVDPIFAPVVVCGRNNPEAAAVIAVNTGPLPSPTC